MQADGTQMSAQIQVGEYIYETWISQHYQQSFKMSVRKQQRIKNWMTGGGEELHANRLALEFNFTEPTITYIKSQKADIFWLPCQLQIKRRKTTTIVEHQDIKKRLYD